MPLDGVEDDVVDTGATRHDVPVYLFTFAVEDGLATQVGDHATGFFHDDVPGGRVVLFGARKDGGHERATGNERVHVADAAEVLEREGVLAFEVPGNLGDVGFARWPRDVARKRPHIFIFHLHELDLLGGVVMHKRTMTFFGEERALSCRIVHEPHHRHALMGDGDHERVRRNTLLEREGAVDRVADDPPRAVRFVFFRFFFRIDGDGSRDTTNAFDDELADVGIGERQRRLVLFHLVFDVA